jgi:hypothetical protein
MDILDDVISYGKNQFDLKIAFKDTSFLMKFLGVFLFFNKKFMTSYTTTIGRTVYFPSEQWMTSNRNRAARVLAHELTHIRDSKESGNLVFSYGYVFPQILSTISISFLLTNNWLSLLFLLFLLPVPSPTRSFWELRGYAISDMVAFEQTGIFSPIENVIQQFVSSSYYFMWPFKSSLTKEIEENRKLIVEGRLSEKIDIANDLRVIFSKK